MVEDDSFEDPKSIALTKVLSNFNNTMDLIDKEGEGFCGCGHAQLVSELLLFACRALEILGNEPSTVDQAMGQAKYAREVFNLLGDLNDTAEIVHEGYKEQGLNKS
jgi:hypothetical protein|tara:strand:- start:238 stop:555 length:318 start_codon:yes stop_codon:yes gene_type:complete